MDCSKLSREELIADNNALRKKNEELRLQEVQTFAAHKASNVCTTLVEELPEYLYSVEFTNGKISAIFHSPQCQDITGYSPEDYIANPSLWRDMIYEADRERVWLFLQDLQEPLHCKSIEHRIIHKDGSVRWVLNMSTVHSGNNGSVMRQSGFLIDVSGRHEEEERNHQLLDETRRYSFSDDLTQLYNRRAFRALAEQQVMVAERIRHPVLLFFIDVDKLKYVNDTFGHSAGDKLLIEVAGILKSTFRESDIIARIGGDEFAVLSMETGPESSDVLLERLRTNVDEVNTKNAATRGISVSAGVSRYIMNECDSVAALIDRADLDMYNRKQIKYATPYGVTEKERHETGPFS